MDVEPAVKTLYEAYDQDDVAMEDFAGVTLDDLYLNVCVCVCQTGPKVSIIMNRRWCHNEYTLLSQ